MLERYQRFGLLGIVGLLLLTVTVLLVAMRWEKKRTISKAAWGWFFVAVLLEALVAERGVVGYALLSP